MARNKLLSGPLGHFFALTLICTLVILSETTNAREIPAHRRNHPHLLQSSPSSKVGPVCPAPQEISPCTCDLAYLSLSCSGSNVTQQTLVNLIQAFRAANGLPAQGWFNFTFQVSISNTLLTSIELTPFLWTRLEYLGLSDNSELSRIFLNSSNTVDLDLEPAMDVQSIHLRDSRLTDDSIEDLLRLVGSTAWELRLPNNRFEGRSPGELIAGLSYLTNLTDLDLRENRVTTLFGNRFRANGRFVWLYLENNEMTQIRSNAFRLDPPLVEQEWEWEINLDRNRLNESSFPPDTGLELFTKRPIHLQLFGNQFTTLPQSIFERIFNAHPETEADFSESPFICDERMEWLKDLSEVFEGRITGIDCMNDPGKTIFTTKLV